jgi:hypothetical protein
MDELFRFVLMRPPERPSKDEVKVLGASFVPAGAAWQQAKIAAEKALQNGKLLAAGEEAPDAVVARAVAEFLSGGPKPAAEVAKLVETQTGQAPNALVANKQFVKAVTSVSETLVALKLMSSSLGRDAVDLTTIARGFDAITRTAEGVDPVGLRPLVMSLASGAAQAAAPGTGTREADAPTVAANAGAAAEAKSAEAEKRLAVLNEAVKTLGALTATDFAPPAAAASESRSTAQQRHGARGASASAQQSPSGKGLAAATLYVQKPWTLSATAVKALPKTVQATLQMAGVDPTVHALPVMLDALHAEQLVASEQIQPIVRFDVNAVESEFVGSPEGGLPTGHGTIQPAGIGDLLLVREHVKAYEGGEISHIENVLQSETMTRDTRRLERAETTLLQESETTKEEERDTQTTERSALNQETSKTIQEEASLKAGLSVDAKYGPFVEVKANAEFATKSSQQETSQQASEYSKDIVARSVSKVVERVRQQRVTTTLSEFEEKYAHSFENAHGAGNISGVYQWLNEVLEAQIYNYGKRMLFDVTLPEPATAVMLLEASEKPTPQGISEPPPLTIDASGIEEWNYAYYAQMYDATNIEAPPAPVKSFSKPFANVQHNEPHEGSGTESISIDSDYEARYALFQCSYRYYEEKPSLVMLIGDCWADAFNNLGYYEMHGETGLVPVAFDSYEIETYAATVEIFCERTQHALEAWRVKTFAAIMEAYVAKQTAYRQAMSALQAEAATAAYGRNPALNSEIINSELRKQCLTLVTGQEFDAFGALEMSDGYAQPNLTRTAEQMPYVRFFEQAFEWEHITYALYPYFWGWKRAWSKRMLLEDSDPSFAEFLRAGAARVVFPVRPGFEEAVLHYLETGQIWSGGPPPTVNSELYVPIVKEIQEAEGAPGEEVPEGEPWPVVLPTTLVSLRANSDLPEWKKVDEEWVAAN